MRVERNAIAFLTRAFSPPLRGGENPGGKSRDCLTPPLRSGENQAVKIDSPAPRAATYRRDKP